MANRKTEVDPGEASEMLFASLERQMRGAHNAAKRLGPKLEAAGHDPELLIEGLLAPIWADIQAGLRSRKVSAGAPDATLTQRLKAIAERSQTANAGKKR